MRRGAPFRAEDLPNGVGIVRVRTQSVDRFRRKRDELARAERPDVIARACDGRAAPSIAEGIAMARELAGEGEVIVAGSIYLMGAARAIVLGLPADPPIAM